jgi:FMN phosphatase YigB (HAD superfamily)
MSGTPPTPAHPNGPNNGASLPDRIPEPVEWIFFDLDGTLWDHAHASLRALRRTCEEFGVPADAFIPLFEEINERAWKALEEGRTTRDRMRVERHQEALGRIDTNLASSIPVETFSRRYLEIYLEHPNRHWIDGAREVLEAAACAGWRVALLTNGFADTQARKIEAAGEAGCVEFIWGPEEAGCLKPRRSFYTTALRRAGCRSGQVLMIGDSLKADVLAPRDLGIDAWWFNPTRGPLPPDEPDIPVFSRFAELLPLLQARPKGRGPSRGDGPPGPSAEPPSAGPER